MNINCNYHRLCNQLALKSLNHIIIEAEVSFSFLNGTTVSEAKIGPNPGGGGERCFSAPQVWMITFATSA